MAGIPGQMFCESEQCKGKKRQKKEDGQAKVEISKWKDRKKFSDIIMILLSHSP